MSDQESQGLSEGSGDSLEKERGYMAIYHDIEEISYGPLCGLPAIARVFLCIRHKLLRDGLGQKSIGHSFIVEKTGLTKRQVISCAQKLEAAGIILIKADYRETPAGRIQFFENKYELNPTVFGEEYNWYKTNPTVRVYSREGKSGSYSKNGIAPSGVKSSTTPGVGSDTTVVSDLVPGKALSIAELLEKARYKNPSSNNPNTNNPSSGDLNFSSKGKKSGQLSDPREEKERQFEAARKAGIL
jgi:hypothetical protein